MAVNYTRRIVPECLSCLYRTVSSGIIGTRPFSQTTIRKAHKTANASPIPNTIPVMLLKAVQNYGKEGAVVPVPVSYMRNKLYPNKQARYIVGDEARQLKDKSQTIAREPNFDATPHLQRAASQEQRRLRIKHFYRPENRVAIKALARERWREIAERKRKKEAKAKAAAFLKSTDPTAEYVGGIAPDRSIGLLESFLPSSLQFERPTNVQTEESRGALPIYGSVSLDDIVEKIRSLVSHNDEAARINFGALNVEFVNLSEGEDAKRVKHIGTYQITTNMKGSAKQVTRTVAVIQEAPLTAEALKQAEKGKDGSPA